MTDTPDKKAFESLEAESRVAHAARMLDETQPLQPNQREDIVQRFTAFIEQCGYTQTDAAREIGLPKGAISQVIRLKYAKRAQDRCLCSIHNWMELSARRDNMLRRKRFVEHSVASEILQVARLVAETCGMGVVFGPAQIGKTMTLESIESDPRFGSPVSVRVTEAIRTPFALCRAVAVAFDISSKGTFDAVFRRLIQRLRGTKRMLVFDEVERVQFKTLEFIRDIHDVTGCPILLCGKPAIYEKLGFRQVGDFAEVTDQLAARIIIRRDLTERTRGNDPQPLYTLEDIRNLITRAELKLHVEPDAARWLQSRASALGTGGIGIAISCLYLAYKVAFVRGDESITVAHLESVLNLTVGHEDAATLAGAVADSEGIRRVV